MKMKMRTKIKLIMKINMRMKMKKKKGYENKGTNYSMEKTGRQKRYSIEDKR